MDRLRANERPAAISSILRRIDVRTAALDDEFNPFVSRLDFALKRFYYFSTFLTEDIS